MKAILTAANLIGLLFSVVILNPLAGVLLKLKRRDGETTQIPICENELFPFIESVGEEGVSLVLGTDDDLSRGLETFFTGGLPNFLEADDYFAEMEKEWETDKARRIIAQRFNLTMGVLHYATHRLYCAMNDDKKTVEDVFLELLVKSKAAELFVAENLGRLSYPIWKEGTKASWVVEFLHHDDSFKLPSTFQPMQMAIDIEKMESEGRATCALNGDTVSDALLHLASILDPKYGDNHYGSNVPFSILKMKRIKEEG